MKMKCAGSFSPQGEEKGQPFPKSWPLEGNMNRSLEYLEEKLKDETGRLYIYILTTVQKDNDGLIQAGSAPNFQGGCITLCSCKHDMRAVKDMKKLLQNNQDVWIAGFAAKEVGSQLFYLMKVQESFASQFELWNHLAPKVRQAKNARHSRFGDLYEPMAKCSNATDFSQYYEPRRDHVHSGLSEFRKISVLQEKPFQNRQLKRLYDRLKNDRIISKNDIEPHRIYVALDSILIDEGLLSKLKEKFGNIKIPYVNCYFEKLKAKYNTKRDLNDLKKLNRYLLEQCYPKETEKINSNSWHKDIDHPGEPYQLVGDPEFSFIWPRPIIQKPDKKNGKNCDTCDKLSKYAQGHRVCDIQSFLSCLSQSNR